MISLFIKSATYPLEIKLVDISEVGYEVLAIHIEDVQGNAKASAIFFARIIEILTKNGKTLQDVGAVYIATGPGSYTGMRLAITIAKTLFLLNDALVLYSASLLAIYQKMNRKLELMDDTLELVFARKGKYYLSGRVDGVVYEDQLFALVDLAFFTGKRLAINGLIYEDIAEFQMDPSYRMDTDAWIRASTHIEDGYAFEPYYLEDVNIG
ncbi:hypothetical protein AwErysi_10100 [Erysipelotrichaceae bacterium]|nr:hypothetical protein AwErysi_10100 [Erysipelotrichaceae bacterium]